jgi:hypothetical protein
LRNPAQAPRVPLQLHYLPRLQPAVSLLRLDLHSDCLDRFDWLRVAPFLRARTKATAARCHVRARLLMSLSWHVDKHPSHAPPRFSCGNRYLDAVLDLINIGFFELILPETCREYIYTLHVLLIACAVCRVLFDSFHSLHHPLTPSISTFHHPNKQTPSSYPALPPQPCR